MKHMNLKRFASTVMAGVMALSLAVPAFATQPKNSTVVTGAYEEIPIAVSVPTTGTAQINPYGLPVSIPVGEEATTNLVGQQITTRPLNIKNLGTVALDVDATLAVVPKGDVSIGTSKGTNGAAATAKQIKVDLEVVGLDDSALAVSNESENLEYLLNTRFANEDTWDAATTLAAPTAGKGDTAADVTPAKSTDNTSPLATLGAVTSSGEGFTYGTDSIALFRLTGELNEEPNDGTDDKPWAAADGFTATIVFKFTPAPPSPGDASVTVAIAGTTAAATFVPGTSGLTVKSYSWSSATESVATIAGNTASATITQVTSTASQTSVITVTATLSNGSTITGTATFTST